MTIPQLDEFINIKTVAWFDYDDGHNVEDHVTAELIKIVKTDYIYHMVTYDLLAGQPIEIKRYNLNFVKRWEWNV